jgi:3-keto-5-aminohexanoate cleavage enzyme
MIINNTTGGGATTTNEARINCLEALPEMASLNLGPDMSKFRLPIRSDAFPHPHEELLFDECVAYTYGFINQLGAIMKEKNIKPELELYHPGHYWVSRELIQNGILEPPHLFQFIMGYQTASFPTPANFIGMLADLPKDSYFGVAGIGKFQWHMVALSLLLGGNVRVGLEDNVYLKRGVKLESNAQAVEKAVRMAKEVNREIASPTIARQMLGLSPTPRQY